MNCPGCLKENQQEFCAKCRKELFDGKKVSPVLSFNSPQKATEPYFIEHTQNISISGVQVKFSVKLENNQLELTEKGGEFLIKPIPIGNFLHLEAAPANEHLTMQLARQAFKINVPPNALVYFRDGSPAYLVKRFDRKAGSNANEKFQQEDFAQIAQRTSITHGENYKYDFSYEEIAALIREHIKTYKIEMEKFFRVILFNYIISNGDAHLKNFSAIQSLQGDYLLTPAYDLLCTKLHNPTESDLALSLFKDEFTKAFEAYGFYTYQDFFEFGKKIGIKVSRAEKIIAPFQKENKLVFKLIQNSFLNEAQKEIYIKNYLDRIKRMNMK
ncbi:HipA domain-containing protein [Flexithrix dorotheae]|uniref:HipA domain-containing protein n=1 Tax=Flexithrix dorotheae TaxID=70993 RepID=UPI00036263F4|nr:HipA domain-containing protein [Flexithrix dorotheae]